MAHDVWTRLLRRRDDARGRLPIRHGALRHGLSRKSPTVGRHDRGGDIDEQDGSGVAQSLRSDARAKMGGVDGIVRERGGVLSLLVLRCQGLR